MYWHGIIFNLYRLFYLLTNLYILRSYNKEITFSQYAIYVLKKHCTYLLKNTLNLLREVIVFIQELTLTVRNKYLHFFKTILELKFFFSLKVNINVTNPHDIPLQYNAYNLITELNTKPT